MRIVLGRGLQPAVTTLVSTGGGCGFVSMRLSERGILLAYPFSEMGSVQLDASTSFKAMTIKYKVHKFLASA